jgi:hypothetical protein
LIDVPELALAPVIPPVTVPISQVKLLGVEAVSGIFGPMPLQVVAMFGVVITGTGFTVTVIVNGVPKQVPVVEVGVTM